MTGRRATPALRALTAGILLAVVTGCGAGRRGPAAPPDLTGLRVMVLPAPPDAPSDLDRELGSWLERLGTATRWVPAAEVERAVERAPASGFDLEGPRPLIDTGGGRMRVADPLYGDLRRLGAILDADFALVPLGIREQPDSSGGAMELTVTVVSVRRGVVLWLGTVSGTPGEGGARAASAAEALARTLFPGEG